MKRAEWLERGVMVGPYYCLCMNEEQFSGALSDFSFPKPWPNFLSSSRAHATTHHLRNEKGDCASVVCLSDTSERTGIEIAGLLLHEAVHIWQEYCISIGEDDPGHEIEAYSIQWIAQQLMWAFEKQLKGEK